MLKNNYKEFLLDRMPSFLRNVFIKRRERIRDAFLEQWKQDGSSLPPPHHYKQAVIEAYQRASGTTTLVETGTFMGHMVEAQRRNFKHIYSIEISEKLWTDVVKRFESYKHIQLLLGDSSHQLPQLVTKLDGPAIFWLDGHYSAGETSRGEKDCPIFAELDAIFDGAKHQHIIIIDDARCFVGEQDYPTLDELNAYLLTKNKDFKCSVKNDLIRIVPPNFNGLDMR
ncbi:MAG: hypothetical protein ACRCYO_01640 [Bacteroidia bacterium]